MYRDSLDKIVRSYFRAVTREPFVYGGTFFHPIRLRVSPMIRRGFTCPAKCGGCCQRFSLEYLPSEPRPEGCVQRYVDFNLKKVMLFHDPQTDGGPFCRYLKHDDGRCGIYAHRPFTCDFELIRVLVSRDGTEATLTQKLFGRGWNMRRIDGQVGALCAMTEPTRQTVAEVVRKLRRLAQWAEHFGIETRVPEIIEWLHSGESEPLFFDSELADRHVADI